MNLIKQPNGWSCSLTALAMLLNRSPRSLILLLGHDGSQIVAAQLKEPRNRRGFLINDLQDVAQFYGYCLVPHDADPTIEDISVYQQEYADLRLNEAMAKKPGLIEGAYGLDQPHMCAWDGEKVYDPKEPRCYNLNDHSVERISVLCFWELVRRAK